MMTRVILIVCLIIGSLAANAQEYNAAFHLGWNTIVPLSDKDYTGSTSSAGARVGYTKFLSEKFGFGLEVGYSTLKDYVPRATYQGPNGATTTDIHNYLYYTTLMANGQYYFLAGKRLIPYTSLGLGVAFSDYNMFYNVYRANDRNTGFVVRPEIGTLFKVKEYSSFGLKAAVGFDYAANKSEGFGTKNFSGINIQVGIVLMN